MSSLFAKAKDGFLRGQIDWENDTIRVCLISGTPNIQKDEFISDVDVVLSSAPLLKKTVENGVAKAQGTVIVGLPDGKSIRSLVIFQDTGKRDKSRLIALVDEFEGDVPTLSEGRDLQIVWGPGNAIFEL